MTWPEDERTWGQRPASEDPDEARDLERERAEHAAEKLELDVGDEADMAIDLARDRAEEDR